MPEKITMKRAERDRREGKSPSTQAGEFVREEMEHIRRGKHGARSSKQAIAIGLSKARRAGVKLSPPKRGSAATKKKAQQDLKHAASHKPTSAKRSPARSKALKREPRSAASHRALSRQAKQSAKTRKRSGASTARRRARSRK